MVLLYRIDVAVADGDLVKRVLGRLSEQFSGESGMHTLQETARRIAQASGFDLASARTWWCDRLPQIANTVHLAELTRAILDCGIKVCILDPAYL